MLTKSTRALVDVWCANRNFVRVDNISRLIWLGCEEYKQIFQTFELSDDYISMEIWLFVKIKMVMIVTLCGFDCDHKTWNNLLMSQITSPKNRRKIIIAGDRTNDSLIRIRKEETHGRAERSYPWMHSFDVIMFMTLYYKERIITISVGSEQ